MVQVECLGSEFQVEGPDSIFRTHIKMQAMGTNTCNSSTKEAESWGIPAAYWHVGRLRANEEPHLDGTLQHS